MSPDTTDPHSWQDREFLLIVALLMSSTVLAINMILPAFEQITLEFALPTATRAGLALGALYAGLAVGQIVLGPLSDTIGRRNTLSIGLLTFMFGSVISGLSPRFEILLVGQIILGFGLGAPRVLTIAIFRDRYSGPRMVRAMSLVMTMFVITPTFAPSLGQEIVLKLGWRSIFAAYLIFGLVLLAIVQWRLPETMHPSLRRAFDFVSVKRTYQTIATNRQALSYAMALGIITGPFVAYLNLSQQIFEFQYELGTFYPLLFAILSLWLGVASLMNGLLVTRTGAERIVTVLILLLIFGSIIALGGMVYYAGNIPISMFVGYASLFLFCLGFLIVNLNALAMQSLAAYAGAGAAFVGALSTLLSIPIAILTGELTQSSTMPLALCFFISASVALGIHLTSTKRTRHVAHGPK